MATTYVHGSTGAWKALVEKSFQYNKGVMHGNPNLICTDGVPDAAAPVGTLCWDVTNSDGYICTVATGTWVKINA